MKKTSNICKFIFGFSIPAMILPIVTSCEIGVVTPDKPVSDNVKVTFDPNGGTFEESSEPSSIYVEKNTAFNSFAHPGVTRNGYLFTGWYNGSEKMTDQKITADIEIKAGWEQQGPVVGDNIVCTLSSGEECIASMETICSQTSAINLTPLSGGEPLEVNRADFNPTNVLIGEEIVTIDEYFMYGCTSFDGTITFSKNNPRLTSIGLGFMNGCNSFAQSLDLPQSLRFIGSSFLYGCSSFDSEIDLSNISAIGDDFMGECSSFTKKLTLSANLQYVGTSFMWLCDNFTQLEVNCPTYAWQSQDPGTLSCSSTTCLAYDPGITITGDNKSAFKNDFLNSTVEPYRKLI